MAIRTNATDFYRYGKSFKNFFFFFIKYQYDRMRTFSRKTNLFRVGRIIGSTFKTTFLCIK